MPIRSISANVSCSNLETSIAWYEKLFGNPPSRRPMAGLAEWQFGDSAAVQLFEAREHAGHSTLTVGVSSLDDERTRLLQSGLQPAEIEEAQNFMLLRLRDPDKNLVVLAAPKAPTR